MDKTQGSSSESGGQLSSSAMNPAQKCRNFLTTLIKLTSITRQPPETAQNVKMLVRNLIDAKIKPEQFALKIQKELNSSPQPYLVPFLERNLPPFRQTLQRSLQASASAGAMSAGKPIEPTCSMTKITPSAAASIAAVDGKGSKQSQQASQKHSSSNNSKASSPGSSRSPQAKSTFSESSKASSQGRSKQEDPEQLRLKRKAEKRQQMELKQLRQQEANLTALASIGPRKKRKVDPPTSSSFQELVKQNAKLEEELRSKDKKLSEQERHNQKLVKRDKEMTENEDKYAEERNTMREQITTLKKKIKELQCEKKEIATNLYGEFQCYICLSTIIEACGLSCGHIFCSFCIDTGLEVEKWCPICKRKASYPVPFVVFDRIILNLTDHLGDEAKKQRKNALKQRKAIIKSIYEKRLLASTTSEGQSTT